MPLARRVLRAEQQPAPVRRAERVQELQGEQATVPFAKRTVAMVQDGSATRHQVVGLLRPLAQPIRTDPRGHQGYRMVLRPLVTHHGGDRQAVLTRRPHIQSQQHTGDVADAIPGEA